MKYNFSNELRERLINYFKKYHKLEISDENADEWLGSLADYYHIITK
jgi:hypothetical protein